MELERELRNVQVIMREDKQIYLVDEQGIIAATKHLSYDEF